MRAKAENWNDETRVKQTIINYYYIINYYQLIGEADDHLRRSAGLVRLRRQTCGRDPVPGRRHSLKYRHESLCQVKLIQTVKINYYESDL